MEIKILILLILGITGTVTAIFTFADFGGNPELGPTNLEQCGVIQDNGAGKINIVFFSTKNQAKEYSDFFLTLSPFLNNKENFNFYYIDSYTPKCELYQDQALLCYDDEMIKKASSCPNDFIVVLNDEESKTIRSSAYMNVMSINQKHTKSVLGHEFGHVFVKLAEEYVPAPLSKEATNCVEDCDKFDIKDSCNQGCSKADYYRSIENGIMRTLSSTNYGIFNERTIVNKIVDIIEKRLPWITGYAVENEGANCDEQEHFLLQGHYLNGQVTLDTNTVESGCLNKYGSGNFEYQATTPDGLIREEFNPELIYTDVQDESQDKIQGEIFESETNFYLKVPVVTEPTTLQIIRDGQVLTEIDLENPENARPCQRL